MYNLIYSTATVMDYNTERSPKRSCSSSQYVNLDNLRYGYIPCSPESASGLSKQAERRARRCQGEQRQHRPTQMISSRPTDIPAAPSANTYHSQLIKRPSALNILERLLQILKLLINLRLRSLSALHSLRLKRLNSFDLPVDIILLDLEPLELFLDVLHDVLVAQVLAVVFEVHGLRRFFKDTDATAGVVVALLESYQGIRGTASEAELRAEIVPVDLEGGGGALLGSLAALIACDWRVISSASWVAGSPAGGHIASMPPALECIRTLAAMLRDDAPRLRCCDRLEPLLVLVR